MFNTDLRNVIFNVLWIGNYKDLRSAGIIKAQKWIDKFIDKSR